MSVYDYFYKWHMGKFDNGNLCHEIELQFSNVHVCLRKKNQINKINDSPIGVNTQS